MNWMAQALDLAEQGKFSTKPNPMVGCVIVKNNQLIGAGAHTHYGGPHSEVIALLQAGSDAKGADVYVNLEPCTHHGHTPPCVDALINAGVKSVTIATTDPNPLVNGKGIERLRGAGIQVTVGILEDQAYALNEIFFHYITQKKPFVLAKWAMSLDGKIALSNGSSKWITDLKARSHGHELRKKVSGVIVGAHTVRLDNPQLNVRYVPTDQQPRPIIITKSGHIPFHSYVLERSRNPLIFTSEHACPDFLRFLKEQQISFYQFPLEEGHLPLSTILTTIAYEKMSSVLVEGGSYLLSAFFKQKLVNRLYTYIAPKIIGGTQSLMPIAGENLTHIYKAMQLTTQKIIPLDQDLCLEADTSITPKNYNDFVQLQEKAHV